MALLFRYRQAAKAELQLHLTTYNCLDAWDQWKADILRRADKRRGKDDDGSIDAGALLGDIVDVRWRSLFSKWLTSSIREKFLALLVVIRQHRAPWSLRFESQDVECPMGVTISLEIFYEIDLPNQQVVLTKFIGPLSDDAMPQATGESVRALLSECLRVDYGVALVERFVLHARRLPAHVRDDFAELAALEFLDEYWIHGNHDLGIRTIERVLDRVRHRLVRRAKREPRPISLDTNRVDAVSSSRWKHEQLAEWEDLLEHIKTELDPLGVAALDMLAAGFTSPAEIARHLGISLSTYNRRLRKIKQLLQTGPSRWDNRQPDV